MHLKPEIITIAALATLILTPIVFRGTGHTTVYSMAQAEDRAQQFVSEGRPASDCFKMHSFIPTYPPLGMFQSGCVREYAEISKNPTVCKLLMPSESGMSCLSTVGGVLSQERDCGLSMNGYVGCNGENFGLEFISINNPQTENCSEYNRQDLVEWCHEERSSALKGIYECDQINTPLTKDLCETYHAFKEKDASLCSRVQEEKRRQYCEIRINAWLNYPELRDSFYFGREVPVDGTGSIL